MSTGLVVIGIGVVMLIVAVGRFAWSIISHAINESQNVGPGVPPPWKRD